MPRSEPRVCSQHPKSQTPHPACPRNQNHNLVERQARMCWVALGAFVLVRQVVPEARSSGNTSGFGRFRVSVVGIGV